jgi:uridine kinase
MSEISEKKENSKQQTLRDRPFLIGISGGSGGGKTSVAYLLHICLGIENCLLFSMDTYYKDLTPEQEKNLNNYNFDTPDALDLDLLSEHLSSLMQWKSIEMPTYDFATNKRQKETKHLTPNKFIIFEGILAFHDKRMRDLMDLKLFIDLDDDIRLSRRIYRDIISRGRKMKDVLDRYHKFVKPAYNTFIKPTKAYADIIIPRGGSNTIAIDLINYYLKYNLTKVFPENINKFIVDSLTHNKDKIEKENKKNNNTNEIIEKEAIAELLKKENIELIKLEDIFEDNICLVDNEEKNLYFSIFKNYLSGQKIQYFDLYLDIFTKKINSIIKDNIIIFKNNDVKLIEEIINKKIISNKNEAFNVFIYIPILYDFSEKIKTLLDYLKNIKEINTINIVCIFLQKEIFEKYQEKNRIEFKSIYSGKAIENYKKFIINGGYYSRNDGEYSNDLISFSESNFEGRLAQLIEINKKI